MSIRNILFLRAVPPLGALLIRLLRLTMRIERVAEPPWEEMARAGEGCILAFWHDRLLFMPFSYRGRGAVALISRHRDGEIFSRVITSFGLASVRGSSTRGGTEALRRLVRELRRGRDVGITPDGPRGPRHRAQPGAVQLARLSGAPIYPLTFAASRFRALGSWDRFQVPAPFSRGVFIWGAPIRVERDADIETKRRELEESLKAITRRADARFAPADTPPLEER